MQLQRESVPNPSTIRAVVRLLGDPSTTIYSMCRRRLLAWGEVVRDELASAAGEDDARLRVRARTLLRSLDLLRWVQVVRALVPASPVAVGTLADEGATATLATDDGSFRSGARPLLLLTMLLSSGGRTCAPDVHQVEAWLRNSAEDLRPRLVGRTAATCARTLAAWMREELGFDGNHSSYFAPDNIVLDRVVARRCGLPVALSILYLVVGRLAGLSMAGVGMPDHFLVRVHGVRPVLVDPFHGGRTVTKADCVRYLKGAGYGSAIEYLRDLEDREVLAHFVRTQIRVYDHVGDNDLRRSLRVALAHLEGRHP